MDTRTVDTQLEYELQDLYRAGKHWLSDISFVADEARFFHDVIDKYFKLDIMNDQGAQLHHCKMMLYQQGFEVISLKDKVIKYLNFLAPFITDNDRTVGIDLIERHTVLENEITTLFESDRILKKELFSLAKDTIDNEKSLFI